MVDGSMIHALPNVAGWATSRLTSPVNTPPSNAPVDVVNFFRPGSVTPTNIGASQSTITDDDKIEITIRDLMNQLEHFSISRNDTLEKLADWYSDRTGLEASGLRFKFPDGRVRCVDWDDGETLEDVSELYSSTDCSADMLSARDLGRRGHRCHARKHPLLVATHSTTRLMARSRLVWGMFIVSAFVGHGICPVTFRGCVLRKHTIVGVLSYGSLNGHSRSGIGFAVRTVN